MALPSKDIVPYSEICLLVCLTLRGCGTSKIYVGLQLQRQLDGTMTLYN
jgi:hypothetical protein